MIQSSTILRLLFFLALIFIAMYQQGVPSERSFRRNLPQAQDQFTKKFLQLVVSGKAEEAQPYLSPKWQSRGGDVKLDAMAQAFLFKTLDQITLIAYYQRKMEVLQRTTLQYEVQFTDDSVILADIAVESTLDNDTHYIIKMVPQPLPMKVKELNAFTFDNKGYVHYVIFCSIILVWSIVAFALYLLLFRCEHSGLRSILWFMVIIYGIPSVYFNWTSGFVGWLGLTIQFFGAKISAYSPLMPIEVTLSLPIGAMAYIVAKYKGMR